MAHTPGPWDIDDDTMEVFSITPGDSPAYIAKILGDDDCNGRPLPPEEIAANARLIAAAPEMLELLRSARLIVEGAGHMDLSVKIWNLIAKAEGRE